MYVGLKNGYFCVFCNDDVDGNESIWMICFRILVDLFRNGDWLGLVGDLFGGN